MLTHGLLYALILGMPITGYIAETARGRETAFFGMFPVPPLAPLDRKLSFYAETAHSWAQYALYALIALHVGAALYHQIVLRDQLLSSHVAGPAGEDSRPALSQKPRGEGLV